MAYLSALNGNITPPIGVILRNRSHEYGNDSGIASDIDGVGFGTAADVDGVGSGTAADVDGVGSGIAADVDDVGSGTSAYVGS